MGASVGGDEGFDGGTKLGGVRPWLRLFLGISGGALAIACALGLLVVLTSAVAQAAPSHARDQAGLILVGSSGARVAPLQSTDALLRVTGNTVRGTVTQRFRNTGSEWLEGSYLFPLPEDAAVDHLRMKVGDRVVEGEIREKEAARRHYDRARTQGGRAALVEQKRPNAFTTRVANIPPGAVIEVELQYQQTLALRDGAWRLRFPSVVAPRYHGAASTSWAAEREGEVQEETDRIADDPSWQPPAMRQGILLVGAQAPDAGFGDVGEYVDAAGDTRGAGEPDEPGEPGMYQPLLPSGHAPLNPIRITVELDPGVPVVQPVSSSHSLDVTSSAPGGVIRYRLQTIADAAFQDVADRDFELEWSPAAAALPTATLRHERHGDSYYGMLVVNPPSPDLQPGARLRRETTFVVDTSGSMGGESIEQARGALAFGLQRLQSGDRFNVIQFNSTHSSLFPAPREADNANLERARRYVTALRADGGTEMRGAIAQALSSPLPEGVLGQVVFITDGAVDYEDELVSLVRAKLGARRLFTVGIGSAPNGFFMRKAAEIGGGTFTYIGNTREVEARMAGLFRKIAQPMSTELAMTFDGGVLAEPIDLPRDLYAGEPLIVPLQFRELPRSLAVSGIAGLDDGQGGAASKRWRIPVDSYAAPDSGLHVLWARHRIEELSDKIRRARHTAAPQDELRGQVVRLALDHHLVSDYTSLVAVDPAPGRPAGSPLQHGAVPANLPAGWDEESLVGRQSGAPLAQTSTSAAVQLLAGTLLLALGFLLLLSRRGSRLLAGGEGR